MKISINDRKSQMDCKWIVPFLLSIKFSPFPVGLVTLPKETVPGKGCQNLGFDIHLMSTVHFRLSLKVFSETKNKI